MKVLLLVSILFLTACSPYESNLSSLGSSSSFNDVNIADNFPAPEDEVDTDEGMEIPIDPVTPIQFKNTFAFDSQIFSLAHDKALKWDGCNQTKEIQGGYDSDTKCGKAYFQPDFADNLNLAFFICVSDAAVAAGFPQPRRVFIRHVGTYNDRTARNSTRLSNHAYARAWDIVNFNLFDSEGGKYKVSTLLRDYAGAQAKFYDEFRDCWKESLPSSCTPGKTEYKGSVGHTASKLGGNTLHNDHLHLSYPLCAG